MMKWVFGATIAPFVDGANTGSEKDRGTLVGCVGGVAGHVKRVVSKCVLVDPIAQFCRELQQG
jgi:hypothetical protein